MSVEVRTLDDYARQSATRFDVIKVDVQGGELPILKGATAQLADSVLAVIAEVEFVELYRGQPLFSDLDAFMRGRGFALFDLDIRRWRRKPLSDEFDGLRVGQTIYADAVYLWDPVQHCQERGKLPEERRQKLVKLAALAERLSVPDFAIEVVELAERVGIIDGAESSRLIGLLNSNRIVDRHDRNAMS